MKVKYRSVHCCHAVGEWRSRQPGVIDRRDDTWQERTTSRLLFPKDSEWTLSSVHLLEKRCV